MRDSFTTVRFSRYKALRKFSLSLNDFNVLVGPNNAGKSTIVGAFRILSEGMRKARSKKPVYFNLSGISTLGYDVPLDDLPVATENIFTDYDDSEPAIIEFNLASGNKLKLVFPENDVCRLVCEPKVRRVTSPSEFKNTYQVSIGFVPILGPVEHNEQLYQKEAARRALLTHRASRNFRNIWYHYPEDFDEFRELVSSTWPGMDIERPEINTSGRKPTIDMFCPEERFPREIFWSGFGFQVWCQMLTYIVRSKYDSLLIIDEPDIYLHSDLQRQLVEILRNISPDILIATHSTEIISEADPGDLLVVNKKGQSAKRIKNPTQLQSIFGVLGSNLNPILTQLAKSRRAVFVEGKDFQIVSAFSRKLNHSAVANRSDFAVIPVEGFNPARVKNFSEGVELTLGVSILKAVVFDRDFRSTEEVSKLVRDFKKFTELAHIHKRKEIENYLLIPTALQRAIERRVLENAKRSGKKITFEEDIDEVLSKISENMKWKVNSQFMARRKEYLKSVNPDFDEATLNEEMLKDFDTLWSKLNTRLEVVPGKELLSALNEYLQSNYSVTLTNLAIVNAMKKDEVPIDVIDLVEGLEGFRNQKVK